MDGIESDLAPYIGMILLFNPLVERIKFGLRLPEGHSILQPPYHGKKVGSAVVMVLVFKLIRKKGLSRSGKLDSARHNAYDHMRLAAQLDGTSQHVDVAGKDLLPQRITQNHHRRSTRAMIVLGKAASLQNRYAYSLEVAVRDPRRLDALRLR